MAEKKKPGQRKKQVSAQTRVKQSQSSKKRKRGLKGTKQGGQFSDGGPKIANAFKHSVAGLSGIHNIDMGDIPDPGWRQPREKRDNKPNYPGGAAGAKETYQVEHQKAFDRLYRTNKGTMSWDAASNEAHRIAHDKTVIQHGGSPSIQEMRDQMDSIQVRKESPEEMRERTRGKGHWKTQRGASLSRGRTDEPVKHKPGKETPTEVIKNLDEDHRTWLEQEFQTKGSPLYQATGKGGDPGAKKRLRQYTDLLQDRAGYSSDEAYGYIKNQQERRGRPKSEKDRRFQSKAEENIQQRIDHRSESKVDKYASGAPSHKQFGYGIRVPGVDSIDKIKADNPDASEADVVRMRQAQRDSVDDWLIKNQRSAHEARQAALTGKTGTQAEAGDRVVFLTTNVGAPAPSVPANSLIGQYIIKKRKKMVVDSKGAARWEVKGEFPAAVRDRHIIEISTGLTVGAQGRYGAYKDIGWRRNNKRSKGFGKQIPVGTKVLRDSNNMPVYDDKGNIRYTEGYTRPFSVGTRDVGLKIYLG